MRTHYCGRVEATDQTVTLAGWVDRRRDHGGVVFLDVRDRTGVVQVVADPTVCATAAEVRNEYVVQVVGTVRPRPPESFNPKLATGALEVVATDLTVLNGVARQLPFPVSDTETVREEVRLKHRYLEMRGERLAGNLRLRGRLVQTIRRYLEDVGEFLEVETPMLCRSTPEGARDYLVPSRVHPGEWYALPQSPQLFKQLLMVGGIDRYYQIARCFRDEDLRADRQPEFTQLDMEMSFLSLEEILQFNEGLVKHVFRELKGIELPDFPRLTYAEAMERYGSDRPDTRFGLELQTVADLFAQSTFKVFAGAIAAGGTVKVLAVPGGDAAISNTRIKPGGDLANLVVQYGAKGLAYMRVKAEGEIDTIGALKDSLTPEIQAALLARTGATPGTLLLFGAGPKEIVNESLGRLRLFLGEELGLIDRQALNLLWVTDFPMFAWNPEAQRLEAMHHPFTSPHPDDLTKPLTVETRALAYDLVWNGIELGGGSLRIYRRDVQEKVFAAIGLSTAEAQEKFGFLLEAFEYGTPPHGGIAYGLDRWAMLLAGATSIRDVMAFPKTQQARDLLTDAPSAVADQQLRELHVRSVKA
ncbi:MAG: aspartate--tRNA ligase [Oscillatoriales cyanobacterium SM2_1_8]|nr:aspartate--tRNA ligase [Oscillatoriales cyanobacterium SM2_1_8]